MMYLVSYNACIRALKMEGRSYLFQAAIFCLIVFSCNVVESTCTNTETKDDVTFHEGNVDGSLSTDFDNSSERTRNVRHRRLQQAAPDQWTYPLKPSQLERPINILSFGGSVTWGSTLKDRSNEAYPFLMGAPYHVEHVDNMAMRATGADYPSLCLESIIPDSNSKNYDVIMFDFVLNGTDGFPLLLKRLKARYPEAIIIYVHIWSIINLARDAETKQGPRPRDKDFDPNRNWEWKSHDTFNPADRDDCGREVCGKEQMEKMVTDAGGYVWTMPRPATVREAIDQGWFAEDWHHLSAHGHVMVANHLFSYLQTRRQELFKTKALGSFGTGDQCWNWFESSTIPLKYTDAKPNNLLKGVSGIKMTLEVDIFKGSTIYFDSRFTIPVPVGLAYMSIREPSDYPKVEVKVNPQPGQPPIVIDPAYNNNLSTVHIVVYAHVGWALPGSNYLTIKPTETKPNPFRVVGIYLCGECAHIGDMGNGAVNSPGYSGPLELFAQKREEEARRQQIAA